MGQRSIDIDRHALRAVADPDHDLARTAMALGRTWNVPVSPDDMAGASVAPNRAGNVPVNRPCSLRRIDLGPVGPARLRCHDRRLIVIAPLIGHPEGGTCAS